jgi:hypothetical protein
LGRPDGSSRWPLCLRDGIRVQNGSSQAELAIRHRCLRPRRYTSGGRCARPPEGSKGGYPGRCEEEKCEKGDTGFHGGLLLSRSMRESGRSGHEHVGVGATTKELEQGPERQPSRPGKPLGTDVCAGNIRQPTWTRKGFERDTLCLPRGPGEGLYRQGLLPQNPPVPRHSVFRTIVTSGFGPP